MHVSLAKRGGFENFKFEMPKYEPKDQLCERPSKTFGGGVQTITFDDVNNPSQKDVMRVLSHPLNQFFEMSKDGKIVPKFVPIDEKIRPPVGRADYGWDQEMKLKHLRSAYARGWPQPPYSAKPHKGVMHIVGGGPSLRECLPALRRESRRKNHFVFAMNKSHDFLYNLPSLGLGQRIPVWGAALLDPCEWVKDYITPRPGVQYLIGDQCAPETFDVFEKEGISRYIWRATMPGKDLGIPGTARFVVGGSTVGLRARTLAYYMGFREIHYWGFDSSVEETEGTTGKLHAYDKVESVKVGDVPERLTIKVIGEDGAEYPFVTNSHMARQANEYKKLRDEWADMVRKGQLDWIDETFHGEGLLPTIASLMGIHADEKRNSKRDQTLIPGELAIKQSSQNLGEAGHAA